MIMAIEEKTIEAEKREITEAEEIERTRECQCFIPRADIYETEDMIVVVTDMPGVDEKSVDITLEKNILTINGYVNINEPEGYSLAWAEYEVGDYQRSFRISNEIDRDKIEATIKDGVLRLQLPKVEQAKLKKIAVKQGD
jgi:HSP20 family molecular chaperone IbpA